MSLDDLAYPLSPGAHQHRRYRDAHSHPCPSCGAMATDRATHCHTCARIFNEARWHARRMPAEDKREMAHAAALALVEHGEVRVRLMGGSRIDYHNPPRRPVEPDSWDPRLLAIPLPETLREPAVHAQQGCDACAHGSECMELFREGLSVLCERGASVLVGGALVEV